MSDSRTDDSQAPNGPLRRHLLLEAVFSPLLVLSSTFDNTQGASLPEDRLPTRRRRQGAALPEILGRLAANTKRIRRARGYSRTEVAGRCGFAPSFLTDIEWACVNITLANLEKLADGLGCTVADLLCCTPGTYV
jgi:DNA-binding Xre family transcriptional regulator